MFLSIKVVAKAALISALLVGCHGSKGTKHPQDAAADGRPDGMAPADVRPDRSVDGPASPDLSRPEASGADAVVAPQDAVDAPIDCALDASVATTEAGVATSDSPIDEATLAPACADDNPCTADHFDGTRCVHTAVADGTACDDGNTCTLGDGCKAGLCVGGTASGRQPLTEVGRIDSYGHEHGIVVSTGDGHLLFADRADNWAVLHTARIENDTLVTEASLRPRTTNDFIPGVDYTMTLHAGWPGHVALTSLYAEQIRTITIDQTGTPTMHPLLRVPRWASIVVGDINGIAGHGTDLWVCVNYSFFGPAGTSMFRYDLSNPDQPVLRQEVNAPIGCGSLAVAEDGKRVYFNTAKGIYWFDPDQVGTADAGAVADADGTDAGSDSDRQPAINGPIGVNSSLTVSGSILVAKTDGVVVLYDVQDQHEVLRVTRAGLIGATYLPGWNALVLMRKEQQADGTTKRWLSMQAASPHGEAAGSEELLLDNSAMTAARIPTSGDVVFDPRTKAAFKPVTMGKLKKLHMPTLGGFGALTTQGSTVQAWSPTARHSLDVSDIAKPTWMSSGGPVVGRVRATGIDVDFTTLIDDPGFKDDSPSPRPGRVAADSTYLHSQNSMVLALREKTLGSDTGSVLLAGDHAQTLAWSAESLYGVDASTLGNVHLRRWDRALLVPSSTPVEAREDLVIPLSGLPDSPSGKTPSLDFPAASDTGLVMIPYLYTVDGGDQIATTRLYWVRRTPLQIVGSAAFTGLGSDCRMSGAHAVCVAFNQIYFLDSSAGWQETTVHQAALPDPEAHHYGLLAFDGSTVYVSERNGLRAVAFNSTAEQIAAAPSIPFSHFPLAMTEIPGGLAVASNHELVTLLPQCGD